MRWFHSWRAAVSGFDRHRLLEALVGGEREQIAELEAGAEHPEAGIGRAEDAEGREPHPVGRHEHADRPRVERGGEVVEESGLGGHRERSLLLAGWSGWRDCATPTADPTARISPLLLHHRSRHVDFHDFARHRIRRRRVLRRLAVAQQRGERGVEVAERRKVRNHPGVAAAALWRIEADRGIGDRQRELEDARPGLRRMSRRSRCWCRRRGSCSCSPAPVCRRW